jgi:hypothetical protein
MRHRGQQTVETHERWQLGPVWPEPAPLGEAAPAGDGRRGLRRRHRERPKLPHRFTGAFAGEVPLGSHGQQDAAPGRQVDLAFRPGDRDRVGAYLPPEVAPRLALTHRVRQPCDPGLLRRCDE